MFWGLLRVYINADVVHECITFNLSPHMAVSPDSSIPIIATAAFRTL